MKKTVRTVTNDESKRDVKTLRELIGFLAFEIFLWAFRLNEYKTIEVTYTENHHD